LRAAIAAQTEHMPVKVKLLAPPHYVMWCAAIDKEAGIELLEKAISRAEAVIKEKSGELVVKIAVSGTVDWFRFFFFFFFFFFPIESVNVN
jgi:translation initiation factor 2 subunit 1